MVLVGLLKRIRGRWACLRLAHRFHLFKEAIASTSDTMNISGIAALFQTEPHQVAEILVQLAHHPVGAPVMAVYDRLFRNNGLFTPVRNHLGNSFHVLSRSHADAILYSMARRKPTKEKRGRPHKYGNRLSMSTEVAARIKAQALIHRVFLYGRCRAVLVSTEVVMLILSG
jgi:hypothetical protein